MAESSEGTNNQLGTSAVTGESFTIAVACSKRHGEFSHTWSTESPSTVDDMRDKENFWPASVDGDDLVKKVVNAET
jgi:hypothetical protein